MPYIKQEDRERVNQFNVKTSGELNYLIHLEIEKELKEKGESYSTYNDIIGVLEVLKHSDYRKAKCRLTNALMDILTNFNTGQDKMIETIGALTCVQMELYRRRVAKFEDKKKKINGDISFYA